MIDSLSGDPLMGTGCIVSAPATRPARRPRTRARRAPGAGATPGNGDAIFFADADKGDDANDGSLGAPFLTVARALAAVRAAAAGSGGGVINLRGGGTFYLPEALVLSAADSGLTIQTYAADAPALAWLSGGVPLVGLTWTAVNTSSGANIYRADVSRVAGLVANVTSLRLNGARLIRARFPNANPETGLPFGPHGTRVTAANWTTTGNESGTQWVAPAAFARNDSAYVNYQVHIGGAACGLYTPPVSLYCGGAAVTGGALIERAQLPNQPYADPSGAVVTAMHGGSWCSFQYEVGAYAFGTPSGMGAFNFSRGGHQCGRPETAHGVLAIENVIEELDAPGEFHFDAKTRTLTLWHNASSGTPPPADGALVAPQLTRLIAAAGSQAAPVARLALHRLGFRDTAPAAFAPHLAPSGSDYAVNREAAVVLEGVAGADIENCTFTRLDNSAVFVGGFARGVVVAGCEFAWLGENGIVTVGDTEGAPVAGWGPNGTAGNQPRGTQVLGNFAHELGIVNKQSCFFYQAVSDGALVEGNVVFNGARHGFQFNDDFGSGSVMLNNVGFGLNRETADTVSCCPRRGGGGRPRRRSPTFIPHPASPHPSPHPTPSQGIFNNWDRLPFTPRKDAQHVDLYEGNLFLVNFNSFNAFDTDDASAYHRMTKNVQIYGHTLKSDYSGHDIFFAGDLAVWSATGDQYQPLVKGYINGMSGFTLLSMKDGDVLMSPHVCPNATDWPNITDTIVYSPTGNVTICGASIASWQTQFPGVLSNVTAAAIPETLTAQQIVNMARATLGA
jgi:hypothetical protein